ncbi:MAG: sigma factor-like helix-turn-helix DNA-binding protein, partial [Planctomycetota bacterium]
QRRARADARRAGREARAVEPAPPTSPAADELFERLEAQKRLAAHVRALPAPYAEVLLRRYYEGQLPEEIGRAMGATPATVRSQIARGLERLRSTLQEADVGRSPGVLPLLVLAAGSDGGSIAQATAGVMTMKLSTKSAALGAAALLGIASVVAIAVTASRPGERGDPIDASDGAVLEPIRTGERVVAGESVEQAQGARLAATVPEPAATPAGAPENPANRETTIVRGRVVDEFGEPIEGALLRSIYAGGRPRGAGNEARTDERGEVLLELADGALRAMKKEVFPMTFSVSYEGRATAFPITTPVYRGETDLGTVELGPGGALAGTVVDDAGVPIENALVYATDAVVPGDLDELRMEGPDRGVARPRADGVAAGRFTCRGITVGDARLWVHARGRLWTLTEPERVTAAEVTDVGQVVLDPVPAAMTLTGIVLTPSGQPCAGAVVDYEARMDEGSIETDAEGRFSIYAKREVPILTVARTPDGSHGPSEVTRGRPGEALELRLTAKRTVVVHALDSAGAPVPDASVMPFVGPEKSNGMWAGDIASIPGARWIRADEEGRATVPVPGERFLISASASGYRAKRTEFMEPADAPRELTLTLEQEPRITGRVTHRGAPVAGARIEVRQRLEDFFPLEAGFTMRLFDNGGLDEWTSVEDGTFICTVGEDWTAVSVLAFTDGLATCEVELDLAPGEGASGVRLEMVRGGTIRGTLLPPPGEKPERLVVAASRGDCEPVWTRPDEDGRYELKGLTPGPWCVEGRDREPSAEVMSVANSPEDKQFNWNAEVSNGEVTTLDVDMRMQGDVAVHGRLLVDGRPAAGWTVAATDPVRSTMRTDGEAVRTGPDGLFVLTARSGTYDLELSGTLEDGGAEVRMLERVKLEGGRLDWERDLRTGILDEEIEPGVEEVRLVRGDDDYDGVREITRLRVTEPGRAKGRVPAGPSSMQRPVTNTHFDDMWSGIRSVTVR